MCNMIIIASTATDGNLEMQFGFFAASPSVAMDRVDELWDTDDRWNILAKSYKITMCCICDM